MTSTYRKFKICWDCYGMSGGDKIGLNPPQYPSQNLPKRTLLTQVSSFFFLSFGDNKPYHD